MSGEEYEFEIDAFTPSTIPMARLAEYLTALAALFGHQDSVHFAKLKKGSLIAVAHVNYEAVPKIRARLQSAKDPSAPSDISKPYKKINELLRADNAVGKIVRGTSNVVIFPGRKTATNLRMGPFTEPVTIDGKVVRIGGTDITAHALIEDSNGKIWSAECTRELAVELAQFLYRYPIRITGNARWVRTEDGEWEILSFKAKEYTKLNAVT